MVDDPLTTVLCSDADDSWGFPSTNVRTSWLIRSYARNTWLRYILLRMRPALKSFLNRVLDPVKKDDVVWVHSRLAHAILLNELASTRGFHLVLHMHNHTGWRPEMASLLKGVRVVFVSRALAEEALANCPDLESVEILHNGADPSVYHPAALRPARATPGPLKILFVGRLIPEKGVHVLLEAMQRLQERSIPAIARIVGSAGFAAGGKSDYIDRLIKATPPNVVFEDYKAGPAVADIYREADVFCCPSVWKEPCPLVLFEALATGLPIVASQVGGIPEILARGGGILVPGDDAEALADALASLAGDGPRRADLSREALRSFTANFAWSAVRKRYQMILGRL
jgi:spore coat protein SA